MAERDKGSFIETGKKWMPRIIAVAVIGWVVLTLA
jgi:hypothetical protein